MSLILSIDDLILEINSSQSTYISLSLSDNTISKLNNLIKKYNIPNPVRPNNFHITLLTSNKSPNIPFGDYKLDLELNDIKKFTVMTWFSNKRQFPDKRLMVLEFNSYQLLKLRNHLINILNLPLSSIPPLINKFHITLSYNVGDKKSYPITKDIINSFPIEVTSFKCLSKIT